MNRRRSAEWPRRQVRCFCARPGNRTDDLVQLSSEQAASRSALAVLRALVGVLFAPNDAVDVFQSDTRPATSQDREFVNE